MQTTAILRAAAILGALAIAAGAFGAHALEGRLEARDLRIFETAVRYQAWHALALLACAGLADRIRLGFAPIAWILGTIVFSGSLFALVLLDVRWLGAITPFGGTALIAGWIRLAFARAPANGS